MSSFAQMTRVGVLMFGRSAVRSKSTIASIRLATISGSGKCRHADRFTFFQQGNIFVYPPVGIEKNRGRAHVRGRSRSGQQRSACFEHAPEKWIGSGPACVNHQALQPLRVRHRERLTDGPAGRVSDQMGMLDLEMVHQPQQVLGHLIDRIANAGPAALAGAAMIMNDNLMMLRDRWNIRIPVAADATEPWDEQNWRARSVCFVMDLDIAQGDFRHELPAGESKDVDARDNPRIKSGDRARRFEHHDVGSKHSGRNVPRISRSPSSGGAARRPVGSIGLPGVARPEIMTGWHFRASPSALSWSIGSRAARPGPGHRDQSALTPDCLRRSAILLRA